MFIFTQPGKTKKTKLVHCKIAKMKGKKKFIKQATVSPPKFFPALFWQFETILNQPQCRLRHSVVKRSWALVICLANRKPCVSVTPVVCFERSISTWETCVGDSPWTCQVPVRLKGLID